MRQPGYHRPEPPGTLRPVVSKRRERADPPLLEPTPQAWATRHLGLLTSDTEPLCYLDFEDRNAVNGKPKSSRIWTKTKRLLSYFVLLFVVLGLVARPLARGALFYQSYWGGPVFVPLVLFVALVILVVAVIDWKRK